MVVEFDLDSIEEPFEKLETFPAIQFWKIASKMHFPQFTYTPICQTVVRNVQIYLSTYLIYIQLNYYHTFYITIAQTGNRYLLVIVTRSYEIS